MYNTLTDKQKVIVDCNESHIVVKACPGSGKTYSVTARLAKLIHEKIYRHQGVAVLSFTNNACIEIKGYLKKHCDINDVGYPHFIGTLDSFINNYIFLPFGHLVMECNKRPELVGTEYNKWYEYDSSKTNIRNGRATYREPNYYFDKVSFDRNGKLIPLLPYSSYHFVKDDWDNQYIADESRLKKVISDIIEAKNFHFTKGKANQADANYLAYKLLLNYPQIANNLTNRFPTIIVDEAQDTTELQMAIIDILNANSLKSLMLIGDPDQAIFEWNTADPSLFMEKYKSEGWHKIALEENRRSSQNICNLLNKFFNNNMNSVAESEHCSLMPEILGHDETQESITSIKAKFLKKCEDKEGISIKEIAILYRGKSFGEQYFNLAIENMNFDDLPWRNSNYHVRDIVHGKYLIDNKGSTYDAILVFLRKASSAKQYKNILSTNYNEPDIDKKKRDEEEIRIVYVACSRPRKLLWLAVCEGEHKTVWEEMLLNE